MTERLAQRTCVPCTGETPALGAEQVEGLMRQVPGWTVEEGKLTRDLKLKNFREALALTNRIGGVAEAEGHHPDICIHSWNRVRIDLYTHAINGLSENDFILAARIDELVQASAS